MSSKNLLKRRKRLFDQKRFKEVAGLGRLVRNEHDVIYNCAVSSVIEEAVQKRDYFGAFRLADRYSESGWSPELIVDYMKRDCGLDGRADRMYKQYLRKKSNSQSKSQAFQA